MLQKENLYNLLILSVYIFLCILVFDSTRNISTLKPLTTSKNNITTNTSVIASLNIDKIKLHKNLYDINSIENNVDKNITILKESIFPDEDNSIMFIAAHSGNSKVSFFNEIDKLKNGDIIKLIYKNKEYTYKINNIWEEDKNGYIHINKDSNKQLILTTCSEENKNKQLVINSSQI